jgi:hypothetical protein
MIGAHQGDGKAALVGGAAGVHGIEFPQALAGEPHAEVVIGHHGGAGRLGDREGVSDMVGTSVGQHDTGDALDRRLLVRDEGRISGEEGIDQAWPATSSRNAEWPNQVICMVGVLCLEGDRGREHSSRRAEINAFGSFDPTSFGRCKPGVLGTGS